MLEAWFSTLLLVVESHNVIALRMLKFASGDADARAEAAMMVDEKFAAALEAHATLWTGGTAAAVVERYRERVSENAKRLMA
jgi:hypothetical protein